jgi:hypothetical protein
MTDSLIHASTIPDGGSTTAGLRLKMSALSVDEKAAYLSGWQDAQIAHNRWDALLKEAREHHRQQRCCGLRAALRRRLRRPLQGLARLFRQ